jgi:hypothetical protein
MRFMDATRTGRCQQCTAEFLAEQGVKIKTEAEVIFPERYFIPWVSPITMEEKTANEIPWWARVAHYPPHWARMSRYAIKPRHMGRREWCKIILTLAHGRDTHHRRVVITESHRHG